MENLLLSVPTDEDLRRAYLEDAQAFLQRQQARLEVSEWREREGATAWGIQG